MEPPPRSRYAVPLTSLTTGVHVAPGEQVEVRSVAGPSPWPGSGIPYGEGGDVDGDGD